MPPRSPYFGRGAVFGAFFVVAALVLAAKFLFFSNPERGAAIEPQPVAQDSGEKQAEFLPRAGIGENQLVFGGAFQKVEDFVPFEQSSSYWTVLRDIKNTDPKVYENAAFLDNYAALLKNPKHYRFAAKPLRFRGIMNAWGAYKAEKNDAGVEDYFRSWILDGDEGYVVDFYERPPVEEAGLRRAPVEVVGIFYQIISYETDLTIKNLFATGLDLMKRGRFFLALQEFQGLLAQDPEPALIARYLKNVEPILWDSFQKEGEEYRGVYQRLVALGNAGAERIFENVPEQYVKKHAPLFLAKSIREIGGLKNASALDRFFGTTGGMLTLLLGLALLVGVFFYFFMRMQKTQDDKLRRDREEFWRQVRRNVKGVTPPGDRFRGDRDDPVS